MAQKNKSTKAPAKQAGNLKPEQEATVEVKALLKDERTRKIAGSVFLLLALIFFIAITSYLFTWDEDQDKVFAEGFNLLVGTNTKMANLMGSFGAILSHILVYKGFGIASYLFCSLFFIIGVNLFAGKKIFSISKNIKYLLLGLPLLSVTASVLFASSQFSWGGAVGDMLRNFLYSILGKIGGIAVILVAFLSYVIWRFNPSFKLPTKKEEDAAMLATEDTDESEEEEEAIAETVGTAKGNKLNANAGIQGLQDDLNPNFEDGITLVEKDAEPEKRGARILNTVINLPKSNNEDAVETNAPALEPSIQDEFITVIPAAKTPLTPVSELTLEVKIAPEAAEEETETEKTAETVKAQAPYDPILDLRDYKYPIIDLLESHGSEKIVQDPQELENNKNQIIGTLKNYDIDIQKISATVGPTVTLYEIIPAPGVRISRIKNLEDDIALSLAALGIRIIAPIPGRGTIGIEVPNTKKTMVSMRTMLDDDKFTKSPFSLPIAIGKRIDNSNFVVDLAAMPHLLMAGATGQGKSVGLNAILVSLLYKKHPSQLKFVLVDPKKVELSIYKTIEKHFLAKLPGEEDSIITDTKKVVHTLNALCIEMDNRYDLLKEAGCRNIKEYNEKFIARKLNPEKGHQFLPFIVLVVDEFADLIMTAGKEVEMPIARLAQLARAIGIHLIIATQRPSVNIITGTIKANFPARIAFKVSSKIDSRTILDIGGAEQLIGKGDMLVSYNGELVRLQCAFVDTPEVDKICDFIGEQRGYADAFLLPEYVDEKELESRGDFDINDRDSLFDDAARLIVMSQSGSTSLLQRKMKLGYNRAGRLMDQLEAAGIVGPNQGSKVRDVLYKTEMELQEYLDLLKG
jgi:DNA segregation ATPase FtsK/SpoIIIE, S-DNA-T family